MPAEYIKPEKYANMINALNTFALKTSETSLSLNAACNTCKAVLGEEDVLLIGLSRDASSVALKYEELASKAKWLATSMTTELELYYEKLRRLTNEDVEAED